jgi:ankyrin repeat protein
MCPVARCLPFAAMLLLLGACTNGKPPAPATVLVQVATKVVPSAQDLVPDVTPLVEVAQQVLPGAKPEAVAQQVPPSPPVLSHAERLTAMMEAAEKGQPSRVWEMLAQGADINDKDEKGETALMKAVAKGHVTLVSLLLIRGAESMERDTMGRTALMRAAEAGFANIVQILLSPPSADVKEVADALRGMVDLAKGVAGDSKVPVAMPRKPAGPISAADIAATDSQGRTALMHAAANGHTALVQMLLARFPSPSAGVAEVEMPDAAGKTAAQLAEAQGHKKLAGWLKDYAEANKPDAEGQTALLQAAQKGDLKTVRSLLAKGADATMFDDKGQTPVMLAAAEGHADVVAALLKSLPDNKGNEKPRLKYLLMVNNTGDTALHLAAAKNREDAAKAIISAVLQSDSGGVADVKLLATKLNATKNLPFEVAPLAVSGNLSKFAMFLRGWAE